MNTPKPRPELVALQPYRSSETAGGRIFLHANENPYPPPPAVVDEIFETARAVQLNRYPPDPAELVSELASYAGVDPSRIWIGDGSNEVLLQACLAFGGPGRTALLFEPTYVMHHRQARMAGTEVTTARRRADFTIDVDDALSVIVRRSPDVVFLCTPNNPTGTTTPLEDVRKIASSTPGLVVVDEAYYEFSGTTIVGELTSLPNVIVARTLSKAFRLASVRLGYGIADPALLTELARVRMPYAQSAFTQVAGTVALRRREEMLEAVPRIIAERDRLESALGAISGVEVFPSGANFVFFRHADAAGLVRALGAEGIVVRDFGHLDGCEGCLRVTAGTPEENDAFLAVASGYA